MNPYYGHRELEVTPRELMFSIVLFIVLMLVGAGFATIIKRFDNDLNLEYNRAVHITDEKEFRQAYRTGIGPAFVEGLMWCDGIYCPANGKKCMCYVIYHESRRKNYWVTVGKESNYCPTLYFNGKVFNHYRFDFSLVPFDKTIIGRGYGRRDVVYTCPYSFSCTVYYNMGNGGFTEPAMIFFDKTAEQARAIATESHLIERFWCIWTVGVVIICGVFVCFDNRWLEDDDRRRWYK